MDKLISILNFAPSSCAECEHSTLVRDYYGTGDSPSCHHCRADDCEYQEARHDLLIKYETACEKLDTLEVDSPEFKALWIDISDAEAVLEMDFGWV
ncbi:hypothetical protein HMPREF3179_03095 [Oligella sp. HMSC09E12]|nr:hypothetical protein HMPREF3179_03095 [Oligella sp. HMSC09E12]